MENLAGRGRTLTFINVEDVKLIDDSAGHCVFLKRVLVFFHYLRDVPGKQGQSVPLNLYQPPPATGGRPQDPSGINVRPPHRYRVQFVKTVRIGAREGVHVVSNGNRAGIGLMHGAVAA